jgi:hypothetical protein
METSEAHLISAITRLPSPFDIPPKFELSRFEKLLTKLGLNEENCHLSAEVREFCRTSHKRYFVPEQVLKQFRFESRLDQE